MVNALIGGMIIGLAVSLMLLFNGRVTGISGILGGLLTNDKKDTIWRWFFIAGLILGAIVLKMIYPVAFNLDPSVQIEDYIIAGLFVGLGTLIGNGCTSGHGVCGLSRFSKRSFIATITFMSFAFLSFQVVQFIRGTF